MAVEHYNQPAGAPYNDLRSGPSRQRSFVLFSNTTDRQVNLYWIDYNGEPSFYLTLQPHAVSKINTFCSHPWIFRDRHTGAHLQVQRERIFWPQPYGMKDPNRPDVWMPCRKKINIHFPLRTLRESCLWRVMSILGAVKPDIAKKIINSLRIPRTIVEDLRELHTVMNDHRVDQPER